MRKSEREELTRQMPPKRRKKNGFERSKQLGSAMEELWEEGMALVVVSVEGPHDFYFLQGSEEETSGWIESRPSDRAVYEWHLYGAHDDYMRAWALMSDRNRDWLLEMEEETQADPLPATVVRTFGYLRGFERS